MESKKSERIWTSKTRSGNDQGLFTMSVGAVIPAKLTNFDIIGHMPREMTDFVIILSITESLLRREYEGQSTDHLLCLMVV